MLEEYDQFIAALRKCGEVACGVTAADSSHRSWHVSAVSATQQEATALVPAQHKASGSAEASASVGLSLAMDERIAVRHGTKDVLLFMLVDTATVLHNSSSLASSAGAAMVDSSSAVLVGTMTYDAVRTTHSDVPCSVLLPLLFNAVRSTTLVSSDGHCDRSQLNVLPDATTGKFALVIETRGAIRKQVSVPVVCVSHPDKRRLVLTSMLTHVMRSHSLMAASLEKQVRARQEAEENLAKATALLAASGARGCVSAGDAPAASASAGGAHKIQKPQSLLHPQQKAPAKRPRGVKIQ